MNHLSIFGYIFTTVVILLVIGIFYVVITGLRKGPRDSDDGFDEKL